LITGIAGFAGRHLTAYLTTEDNHEILGIDLNFKNFNSDNYSGKIELLEADLTDRQRIFSIIKKFNRSRSIILQRRVRLVIHGRIL